MYDPETECENLVERLKILCSLKDLSVNAAAKKAGISSSALSELLNRKTRPQLYTVYKLCNALEVSVNELISDLGYEQLDSEEKLTPDEKYILYSYRHMTETKREMTKIFINALVNDCGKL